MRSYCGSTICSAGGAVPSIPSSFDLSISCEKCSKTWVNTSSRHVAQCINHIPSFISSAWLIWRTYRKYRSSSRVESLSSSAWWFSCSAYEKHPLIACMVMHVYVLTSTINKKQRGWYTGTCWIQTWWKWVKASHLLSHTPPSVASIYNTCTTTCMYPRSLLNLL